MSKIKKYKIPKKADILKDDLTKYVHNNKLHFDFSECNSITEEFIRGLFENKSIASKHLYYNVPERVKSVILDYFYRVRNIHTPIVKEDKEDPILFEIEQLNNRPSILKGVEKIIEVLNNE